MDVSRRVFVRRLTFLGGGVVLLGSACSKQAGTADAGNPVAAGPKAPLTSAHKTFTDDEFRIVSAAVDRLLPKDEDPGALDANVPEYIDRALQVPELSDMREQFLPGIAALNRRANGRFQKSFDALTPAQQDELLTQFKNSKPGTGEEHWYEMLLALSMEGFLGDPSYGGNKDKIGWKLVGFDIVGTQAMPPPDGYDGRKHLQHMHGGRRAKVRR